MPRQPSRLTTNPSVSKPAYPPTSIQRDAILATHTLDARDFARLTPQSLQQKSQDVPGWQSAELANTLSGLKVELPPSPDLNIKVESPVPAAVSQSHDKEKSFTYLPLPAYSAPDTIRLIAHAPLSFTELPDVYYSTAFKNLHTLISTFITTHLCPSPRANFDPARHNLWNAHLGKEFLAHIAAVTIADEACGGWDRCLNDPAQRAAVLEGVFWRVLEKEVWNEMLFGCGKWEEGLFVEIEKTLVERDAFARTALRALTTHTLLRNPSTLPPNFHLKTITLASKFHLLLSPLLTHLSSPHHSPTPIPHSTPKPLQSLSNIFSTAAHLSLQIRCEATPFSILSTSPGMGYDGEQAHSLLAAYAAESRENVGRVPRKGMYRGDIRPQRALHFKPVVKGCVWPRVERMKRGCLPTSSAATNITPPNAGNGIGNGNNVTRAINGFRVAEICKSGVVVYYSARTEKNVALKEFLRKRRGWWERWGGVVMVVGWVVSVCLLVQWWVWGKEEGGEVGLWMRESLKGFGKWLAEEGERFEARRGVERVVETVEETEVLEVVV